ncbi:MAG: DUF4412 domain-containing protein [Acidobacteria bacterium]|nr:DUF4412 domain-containing protein [Acidobacteriota bacterium]
MSLAAAFGLLLGAGAAGPELYFQQTVVTSVDGRSQGPGVVSQVWHSGRRMRLEAGEGGGAAFILRLDSGQAYRLDPETKTAVAVDAERLRARSHMEAAMAGDLMGGDEEGAARTAPLKTPRTLAGYPCRGYRITAGSTVLDVYATDRIPVGIDAFADFLEWSGAAQSLRGLMAELRRIRGFPLETRARVSVLGRLHETVSTVTRVRVGPHPSALFEPPPGWRVVTEEPEE